MSSFDGDLDDLISGFQHSVHAGDRGHALRDLRCSLFSSLASVALCPSTSSSDACHPVALPSPVPSPSPSGTSDAHWTLLPPPVVQDAGPPLRARSGRTSPSSHVDGWPSLSSKRRSWSGSGSRARPTPYSTARRKLRPHGTGGSLTINTAVCHAATRPASRETGVATALAELHMTGAARSNRRRSEASSPRPRSPVVAVSASSSPARTRAPSISACSPSLRLSPAWSNSLALTPLHQCDLGDQGGQETPPSTWDSSSVSSDCPSLREPTPSAEASPQFHTYGSF